MMLLRGIPAVLVPAYLLLMLGAGLISGLIDTASPLVSVVAFLLGLLISFGFIFGPAYAVFRMNEPTGKFASDFPRALVVRTAPARKTYFMTLGFTYVVAIAILIQGIMRFPGISSFGFWIFLGGASAIIVLLLLVSYFFGK